MDTSNLFYYVTIFRNYIFLPVSKMPPQRVHLCLWAFFFQHPKAISLESFATILAQLLSLSMGIAYDDIDTCQCPESICIMNPDAM